MERLSMIEAFDASDRIIAALEADGLVIFPTDTIYGIGCCARSEAGLLALRSLKGRWGKPFSIIAPSKEWICERFELNGHDPWLDKLPGPFTLVFTPKEPFLEQLSMTGSVGIRIPDHPVSELVARFGSALVATSVNSAGFEHLVSLEQLEDPAYERFSKVAFAIDDGTKPGPGSTVVDLTGVRPVYLRM